MELKQYNGLKGFFGISDDIEIPDDEVESEYPLFSICSAAIGPPVRIKTKDGRIIEGFKSIIDP